MREACTAYTQLATACGEISTSLPLCHTNLNTSDALEVCTVISQLLQVLKIVRGSTAQELQDVAERMALLQLLQKSACYQFQTKQPPLPPLRASLQTQGFPLLQPLPHVSLQAS
jgi:hypothetical protein